MGRFDGVLMVTDLDGTFLGRKSRLIERNLEAVERFRAEGGLFTAATGRIHHDLLALIPQAGTLFNAPAIIGNGSCLYDFSSGESFCERLLTVEQVRTFMHYVHALEPGVGVRVSTSAGFLGNADWPNEYVERDLLRSMRKDSSVWLPMDAWDLDGVKLYKMVVRGPAERLAAIRPVVEAHFGAAYSYTSSSAEFYEVQTGGCDKGTGLVALAGLMASRGTPPRLTIAVGNHENDLPMLRAADMAACPSDSLPDIIPYCREVLGPFADGCIADLIERMESRAD